ncbi:MAG: DUF126 domain-containing protein [Thermoplasmata archaeon]|nr:DUF126 domain-containing protein [Thermoplasmata archaeon]
MKFHGKGIGHGKAEGEIVVTHNPISFLGGVDPEKGMIIDKGSDIFGKSFAGKILVFPHGKGSTVGSYVIYQLKKSGAAPSGMINTKAETIVATGAILANIPMLNRIPTDIFLQGDHASIDADNGMLTIANITERPVITVIMRNGEDILLLKRSDKVGTFKGHWSGVSGGISEGEEPVDAAVREISEETSKKIDKSDFSIEGRIMFARDDTTLWKIHPYLLDVDDRSIQLDWEHDEFRWTKPSELQNFKTVPKLDRVVDMLLKEEDQPKKKSCQ